MYFADLLKKTPEGVLGIHLAHPVSRIMTVDWQAQESGYQIEDFVFFPVQPGQMSGGNFKDLKGVADALKGALKERGIERRLTALSIPDDKAIVRRFQIPGNIIEESTQEEIAQVLFQRADLQGISREDLLFDYRFHRPPQEYTEGDTVNVLFVAVRSADALPYLDIVEQAGLKVASLEVDSLALSRVVHYALPGISSGYQVVSHIADDKVILCAFNHVEPHPVYYREQEYAIHKQVEMAESREEILRSITESVAGIIERQLNMFMSAFPNASTLIESLYLSGNYHLTPDLESMISHIGIRIGWLSLEDAFEIDETLKADEEAMTHMYSAHIAAGLAMRGHLRERLIEE